VILSVVRCLLIWKNKKVCDIVILSVVGRLLIWKNKKVTLLLIWENKKVCDELHSQVPYHLANRTKFNCTRNLNPESPDDYRLQLHTESYSTGVGLKVDLLSLNVSRTFQLISIHLIVSLVININTST
jgi:hypothetical protein